MTAPALQLEYGKRYRTRDGRETEPLVRNACINPAYAFYCHKLKQTWTESGKWSANENNNNLDLVEEIPHQLLQPNAEQARAWFAVWDLCVSLGMSASGHDTGKETVLSFIRNLATPQPAPAAEYSSEQHARFVHQVRQVLDKNYFLSSKSLGDMLYQITCLAETHSQKPQPAPTPNLHFTILVQCE